MAKLLFKLAGVPEDEAEDVRQLLEDNEVEYYETSAGLLGLSFAAIWIKQDDDLERAKQKLDEYQTQRYQTAQENKRAADEEFGKVTLWQAFKSSPVKLTLVTIFIGAVLYFSIKPFFPA